jgi:hypothetical protein
MEELFNELIIQTRQRAGLLAVIMGFFMTSKDEDSKRTMAIVLNQIFEDHPVNDDLEKILKNKIKNYLEDEEADILMKLFKDLNQMN